jgi:GH18 family chitinase
MEDPETGADLGQAGAFSWHDQVPEELSVSFSKASEHGVYDQIGGGHYYWDETERLFWSWDTPNAIRKKLAACGAVEERKLGGIFTWGLGEDAPKFDHLRAANAAVAALSASRSYEERSEL